MKKKSKFENFKKNEILEQNKIQGGWLRTNGPTKCDSDRWYLFSGNNTTGEGHTDYFDVC